MGNALRLERRFGAHMRWCDNWLRWLVWDGAGWAQDSESGPRSRHLAHTLTAEMMRRTDLGKGFVNYAKKCRASGKISAMLKECSAVPGLLIRSDDLDTHDDLLAVANGVIDLRTGVLRPPDPALLISRRSPLVYEPAARCPVFEAYLEQIMKDRLGLVDLLVRALGYSMTGQTRDHKFFLLYGDRGRNGKGTLLGTMQMVLGRDLCSPISKRLLTNAQSSDARFDMAMLEGLRLVFANEAKDGTRLDAEWIKEYSSGDPMRVERKGVDSYEITPKGKLWYGVNSLPSTEFDTAYGSRVIPIPFEQSYYPRSAAEWREGDLEPDLDLRAKLRAELPGILAFLVRAAGMYYERGFAELPDEVNRVKREYRAANDPVSDFIAERCEPGGGERRGVLYEAFREWAKAQGRPWKGGPQAFAARIEREPGVRITHDGGIYMVRGIHKRFGEMPPLPTDDLYAEGE